MTCEFLYEIHILVSTNKVQCNTFFCEFQMDAFVLQEQSWIVIETTWSHKLNMLRICLTHFIFLGQSLRNSFFQIFQLGTCAPLCTWEQKVQCPLPNLYSLLRIVLQLWEVSPASRVQSRKGPIISSMLPHGISLGKMVLWWSLVPWCPDALACTDATHPGMGVPLCSGHGCLSAYDETAR